METFSVKKAVITIIMGALMALATVALSINAVADDESGADWKESTFTAADVSVLFSQMDAEDIATSVGEQVVTPETALKLVVEEHPEYVGMVSNYLSASLDLENIEVSTEDVNVICSQLPDEVKSSIEGATSPREKLQTLIRNNPEYSGFVANYYR